MNFNHNNNNNTFFIHGSSIGYDTLEALSLPWPYSTKPCYETNQFIAIECSHFRLIHDIGVSGTLLKWHNPKLSWFACIKRHDTLTKTISTGHGRRLEKTRTPLKLMDKRHYPMDEQRLPNINPDCGGQGETESAGQG